MKEDSYVGSPVKQALREVLVDLAGTGRVLTLGGPNCLDLFMFVDAGCQVVSVEHERAVYEAQLELAGHRSGATFVQGRLEDYIAHQLSSPAKEQPFDLVFLDFCGHYTAEREEVIRSMMKSRMVRPGTVLAMTFAAAHERGDLLCGAEAVRLCGNDLFRFADNRVESIKEALAPDSTWLSVRYDHGRGKMQMIFMLTKLEGKRCGSTRTRRSA